MNNKILDTIEVIPDMNKIILEALISKNDPTSLYASKLIMELKAELAQSRPGAAPVGYRQGLHEVLQVYNAGSESARDDIDDMVFSGEEYLVSCK